MENNPNKAGMNQKIYLYDEADNILDQLEGVLYQYGIRLPTPEDIESGTDIAAQFYGCIYADLLDSVESGFAELLKKHTPDAEVIEDKSSNSR